MDGKEEDGSQHWAGRDAKGRSSNWKGAGGLVAEEGSCRHTCHQTVVTVDCVWALSLLGWLQIETETHLTVGFAGCIALPCLLHGFGLYLKGEE